MSEKAKQEVKQEQGFMDELRKEIHRVYETAVYLDLDVRDRGGKYFGYDYKEEERPVPDAMAGEMLDLLHRTIILLDRAHKHVLEV